MKAGSTDPQDLEDIGARQERFFGLHGMQLLEAGLMGHRLFPSEK
jgi:hypothetical protein